MSYNVHPMTPRELLPLLPQIFDTQIPVLIIGAPGVSKSAMAKSVANSINAKLEELHLTHHEPTTLLGLPDLQAQQDGTTISTYGRPYFFPPEDSEEPTLIFLDEFTAADDATRRAAFQLLRDRQVGPHRLGKNVHLMAAGNTEEDGSEVYTLDRANTDTFIVIRLVPSYEDWVIWAKEVNIDHRIMSFLAAYPEFLECSDMAKANRIKIAPSPRSWEHLSKILQATGIEVTHPSFMAISSGKLGADIANQFKEYLMVSDSNPSITRLLELGPATYAADLNNDFESLISHLNALIEQFKTSPEAFAIYELFEHLKTSNLPTTNNSQSVVPLRQTKEYIKAQQLLLSHSASEKGLTDFTDSEQIVALLAND